MLKLAAVIVASLCVAGSPRIVDPQIIETRIVDLTQTVTLADIPKDAKDVRLWVPIPSDASWQRVLDRRVVSVPAGGTWRIVRQAEGRGDFVVVALSSPTEKNASVVVQCTVERKGVHFPIDPNSASGEIQVEQFAAALDKKSPLMMVDTRIQELADKICGEERDPARQAHLLMMAVAKLADHYSKDPSKPKCGRGAASDCLDHGGGCCTDMHSLFIALARARGVPARMQYGYRLSDATAGAEFDPGYRCLIEFFAPGTGWVPTDIVAADNAETLTDTRWESLSATRVWLWEGRSFDLTPKNASGPVDTMLCGWAEIDGKPVDVLPAEDGTPSKLTRKVKFEVVKTDRVATTPKLPE